MGSRRPYLSVCSLAWELSEHRLYETFKYTNPLVLRLVLHAIKNKRGQGEKGSGNNDLLIPWRFFESRGFRGRRRDVVIRCLSFLQKEGVIEFDTGPKKRLSIAVTLKAAFCYAKLPPHHQGKRQAKAPAERGAPDAKDAKWKQLEQDSKEMLAENLHMKAENENIS